MGLLDTWVGLSRSATGDPTCRDTQEDGRSLSRRR